MKNKRTIALLLVLVMLTMFLAGCASTAEPATEETASTQEPASTSEAAAEEPEEEAAEIDPSLPSADVAEQGVDYYDGAMTYEEVTAELGPLTITSTDEIQLGYVCKAFENEFWRMQKEGAEQVVADLIAAGVNISMDVRAAQVETDEQGQLAVMNDMINKDYDALLVSPIAEGNLIPGVESAMEKEIPMSVVNSSFMPHIPVTVGARHLAAGELAAEWVNEQLGGEGGQVAIIMGMPKATSARSRTEGFENWFKENNPDVEVVAIQNADWDRMKAKDVADVWLKQYPDLKAIYANNDTMAMGALEAVKAADKLGSCYVLGTDGTSEAFTSIAAGELSATISSFPYYMSQIATEMLLRQLEGQDVPKVIYTPQVVIDSSNVDVDPAELIGWQGINIQQ